MVKIAHINEIETISHLPLEVINVVSEIVAVLDDNYETNRDVEHELGGYILIAENEKDAEKIRNSRFRNMFNT